MQSTTSLQLVTFVIMLSLLAVAEFGVRGQTQVQTSEFSDLESGTLFQQIQEIRLAVLIFIRLIEIGYKRFALH
jgi:hypothetical protein